MAKIIVVSRQAVAKWETGDSIPDIVNCDALAQLYDVTIDDLLHHDGDADGVPETQGIALVPSEHFMRALYLCYFILQYSRHPVQYTTIIDPLRSRYIHLAPHRCAC